MLTYTEINNRPVVFIRQYSNKDINDFFDAIENDDTTQVLKILTRLNNPRSLLNMPDEDNFTPLMRAIEIGSINMVKCLANRGANLELSSNLPEFINNITPLFFAIFHGRVKIVNYLIIEKGVKLDHKISMDNVCGFGTLTILPFIRTLIYQHSEHEILLNKYFKISDVLEQIIARNYDNHTMLNDHHKVLNDNDPNNIIALLNILIENCLESGDHSTEKKLDKIKNWLEQRIDHTLLNNNSKGSLKIKQNIIKLIARCCAKNSIFTFFFNNTHQEYLKQWCLWFMPGLLLGSRPFADENQFEKEFTEAKSILSLTSTHYHIETETLKPPRNSPVSITHNYSSNNITSTFSRP